MLRSIVLIYLNLIEFHSMHKLNSCLCLNVIGKALDIERYVVSGLCMLWNSIKVSNGLV